MSEYILADGSLAPVPDQREQKVVWTLGTALVISILFFTGLHHCFPEVFNVPPRTYFDKKIPPGSSLLKNPPPEWLHQAAENYWVLQAAPGSVFLPALPNLSEPIADKSWYITNSPGVPETLPASSVWKIPDNTILRLPLPGSDWFTMFLLDLIPIGLAALCFYHGLRRLGPYRAMLFLAGSFVFTGLEESMWILLGRFQEQLRAAAGSELQNAVLTSESAQVQGTYYFTKGFFWFLETPLLACLGWFFVAYSCVYVADILWPKRSIWFRAAAGGLLAMNLDLWLDPVQTSNTFLSWIWAKGDRIEIFSIPLSNFLGWFLLIFLFALLFDKVPAMIRRWGPVKTAVYFYSLLFIFEIGILLFFIIYGAAAMRLLPSPVNFTIGDIGRYSLSL